MGKHRHKKSFYDVDEEELQSSRRHRHHRRRHHSSDKQDETKQRVPSLSSYNNSKMEDDEAALLSPPTKRQRATSQSSQSPAMILSQLIENPEFLANAGAKAREFAETARQLLANPDLDPTTQQIICAMAQAAVNVGKRLSSSSSSTPADQCVDEISVTNSTTYSSSALLSPTLSNASSSSTPTTPQQQQQQLSAHREESKAPTEPESDEDILIKQMIERAMKLTQQGDTRHAQHLLGVIHEKLSNKRQRAAAVAAAKNEMETTKTPSFRSTDETESHEKVSPPVELEQSNEQDNPSCYFSYPPPPPLPPPQPLPPLPDEPTTAPPVTVPRMEKVQELLSNPSEVQDILKKLFGANETHKVSPPEELESQSHMSSTSAFYSQSSVSFHHPSSYPSQIRHGHSHQPLRPPIPVSSGPQPYNSSLAFMQGNRRTLPPLQTPDRCFSSSNTKNNKVSHQQQAVNRSYSFSSSASNGNGMMPLHNNQSLVAPPLSAPPLMKVNPTFPSASASASIAPLEPMPTRWSVNHEQQYYNHTMGFETNPAVMNNDQQRSCHPFWCATCALGFPHQAAYQDHLRSHIPCNVPGCSYAASEQLVRIHHQNIHENSLRNRMGGNLSRPMLYQQPSPTEPPWPLMRIFDEYHVEFVVC